MSNTGRDHHRDRIWDLIEGAGVCMLTTRFGSGLRARPLQHRADRSYGLLWFLTDARSGKEREIAATQDVGLVFIDEAQKAYLSITAQAHKLDDHAKAAGIWRATDSLWWCGPDDPNLRVLRVTPLLAELWDGPANTAGQLYEFAKAMFGAAPNLGENRKISERIR